MATPPEPRKIDANPAVCTATAVSDWFVKPPATDKFTPRAGNSITLLDCGEEYLPKLREAFGKARQSIYIAIWGMDEELNLFLDGNRTENQISSFLQQRAKDGVEIKVMVWFSFMANSFGTDPTLRQGVLDLREPLKTH